MAIGRSRLLTAVPCTLLAALVVAASACGSQNETEESEKQSGALTGDGSTCRHLSLSVRTTPSGAADIEALRHDVATFDPPFHITLPSSIPLSQGGPHRRHEATLTLDGMHCTYVHQATATAFVASFVSCTDTSLHVGSDLSASTISLDVAADFPFTASLELDETEPCGGSDAGSDAGGGSDSGGGGSDAGGGTDTGAPDAAPDSGTDAGVDSGPTCSPDTCTTTQVCMAAQCVSGSCVISPSPVGTACNDQSACTTLDSCDGNGHCVGMPTTCNSNNACLVDGCDPVLGCTQAPAPAGTPCPDDLNACNGTEACDGAGACGHVNAPTCTTSNECLVPSCDPAQGCITTPKPVGSVCGGTPDACHVQSACDATGTCQTGAPIGCAPLDVCHVASCDATLGCVQTAMPNCDPTPVAGDAAFETRASVIGKLVDRNGAPVGGATFIVTDAPAAGSFTAGAPRSDVAVSVAPDGSFRLRLTTFPDVEADRSPPSHVLLRIEAPGLLPAYRDAWLHTGSAEDLGTIRMVPRDTAVSLIGPAGGTATDSQGRIQVVIPAGALATTIPVVITPLDQRDDMPAPLPSSTPTQYGFELEPSGQTFAVPVTIRVANSLNLPTSLSIPLGYYDKDTGRWEHEGTATWDGQRFAVQTNHFPSSPGDLNAKRGHGPVAAGGSAPPPNPCPTCFPGGAPPPGGGAPPEPPSPPDPTQGCASDAVLAGGSVRESFTLPTYLVRDENIGVSLTYDSGLAGSRTLGTAPADEGVVPRSGFAVSLRGMRITSSSVPLAGNGTMNISQPGLCSAAQNALGQGAGIPLFFEHDVAGSQATETFSLGGTNTQADTSSFFHLPLVGAQVASSGLYLARTVIRAQSPGSCITSGGTFGVSDEQATGIQTNLVPGPLATFDRHVLVNQRVSSPFGAGWSLGDLSRVHRSGDIAYVAHGSGWEEHFRPRAFAKTATQQIDEHVVARDPQTGEVLIARSSGSIQSVNVTTGALTTILSGLPIPFVQGLAVAYPGGSRQFVVWTSTQLLAIDGGGGTTVLATRPATQFFQQASVAARGDLVFFTDAVTNVLYRTRLTDPTHTVETLSLATGGDLRLFPRTQLSGVTFADPRGMAFAADGSLYLTDVRRNELYSLRPQSNGEVGGASRVDAVVGDGTDDFLTPLGELLPGAKFALREPIDVKVAEDGFVFIVTPFGLASFDPIAQQADWVVWWDGIDELLLFPTATTQSFAALTSTSLVFARNGGNPYMGKLTIDRLSSEFEPTRSLSLLSGGGYELLDTQHATLNRFDRAGRLSERRKRTGELIMGFTYADAQSDKLDHITDAAGGQIAFGYDGAGKLASISDPRGRTTLISVDSQGDLVSLVKPDGETWTLDYEQHRLAHKHSPRNDTSTHTFRADGTVATAQKPGGALTQVDAVLSHPPSYDASGKLVRASSYVDAHGVTHQIQLNGRSNVERDAYVADGVARVEQLVYAPATAVTGTANNPLSLPSGVVNRIFRISNKALNGVSTMPTQIAWDDHFRLLRERPQYTTDADSHTLSYRDDGWLDFEYTGAATARVFERDSAGHVTRSYEGFVSPSNPGVFTSTGNETLFTYRVDGQPATMTDHNIVRTYSYDDAGGTLNELGWTDNAVPSRSMSYTRDAFGNVTRSFDGTATTFATFDLANRLVSSRDALGNETTYGYAFTGCGCSQENLITSIHTPDLPAGVDWLMNYDPDGLLASVTDPQGFTESYAYETTGELKTLQDKLLRNTSWTHDQLGRVLAMTDTLARAHANTYTVPGISTSSNGFDLAGTGPTLTAGSGDASAPSTTLSSPLRAGDYQIGQSLPPPEGFPAYETLYRDATFQLGFSRWFDRNKRLVGRGDRANAPITDTSIPSISEVTNRPFWQMNPSYNGNTGLPVISSVFSRRTTPDGTQNELATFGQNQFYEETSNDGLINAQRSDDVFTRDAAGRITKNQRFYGGGPGSVSTYTYSADGRRLAQVVNIDGTHDFTYNSRGLMETETVSGEGTYTFGYDEMGRSSELMYPDGHQRHQRYDELGRLNSRCYEYSLGTLRCYTAQFDAVGNPVRMTDPDGVDVLEYDALDRLKKVTRYLPDGVTQVGAEDYAFNALGALKVNAGVTLDDQRPKLAGGGTADAAVPNTIGGMPVGLNAGGFVTSLRGTSFTYDSLGNVTSAQDPIPAPLETYFIDGTGRRYRKDATSTEFYVFEGLDRIAVTDASAVTPKELYLFDGIDHPLRIKIAATSTTAYYELDLAGNVRALRASGGSSLGGYRYTAFGQTVEDTTTVDQPLRWKGRWFSPIAGGIYDVRARQWSPEMGTFLAVDEFEFFGKRSTLWGWPRQNPNRFPDPTGRAPCDGNDAPWNPNHKDAGCWARAMVTYLSCMTDILWDHTGCALLGLIEFHHCVKGTVPGVPRMPNRQN